MDGAQLILGASVLSISLYSGLMAGDVITTELALKANPETRELSPLGQSIQARIALAAASDTVCILIDHKLSRRSGKLPLWVFRGLVVTTKGLVIYNNLRKAHSGPR